MARVKVINGEWLIISKGLYKISEIEAIGHRLDSTELMIHMKSNEEPFIHQLHDDCNPTIERIIEALEGIEV